MPAFMIRPYCRLSTARLVRNVIAEAIAAACLDISNSKVKVFWLCIAMLCMPVPGLHFLYTHTNSVTTLSRALYMLY